MEAATLPARPAKREEARFTVRLDPELYSKVLDIAAVRRVSLNVIITEELRDLVDSKWKPTFREALDEMAGVVKSPAG